MFRVVWFVLFICSLFGVHDAMRTLQLQLADEILPSMILLTEEITFVRMIPEALALPL